MPVCPNSIPNPRQLFKLSAHAEYHYLSTNRLAMLRPLLHALHRRRRAPRLAPPPTRRRRRRRSGMSPLVSSRLVHHPSHHISFQSLFIFFVFFFFRASTSASTPTDSEEASPYSHASSRSRWHRCSGRSSPSPSPSARSALRAWWEGTCTRGRCSRACSACC